MFVGVSFPWSGTSSRVCASAERGPKGSLQHGPRQYVWVRGWYPQKLAAALQPWITQWGCKCPGGLLRQRPTASAMPQQAVPTAANQQGCVLGPRQHMSSSLLCLLQHRRAATSHPVVLGDRDLNCQLECATTVSSVDESIDSREGLPCRATPGRYGNQPAVQQACVHTVGCRANPQPATCAGWCYVATAPYVAVGGVQRSRAMCVGRCLGACVRAPFNPVQANVLLGYQAVGSATRWTEHLVQGTVAATGVWYTPWASCCYLQGDHTSYAIV